MKKKEGCYYCEQNENFRSLLFRICDLKASTVFLCRDQTLPGRCTIMFKDHNDESFQIPKEEREEFVDDMCALAETIRELFGADKINYGIYGDEVTCACYRLPQIPGEAWMGRSLCAVSRGERQGDADG